MNRLRLMAVHAHPDDESSKGAATMARYAAQGHEVLVVTLTGGERGDILNPAMDMPGVRERLTDIRREEMAKAAEILGVQHVWLGFVDSGLPEGDPLPPLPEKSFGMTPLEIATEALVKVIRKFCPHVMITYDENGGYPHPDHIKCHQVSMAAFDVAGDPAQFPQSGKPWTPAKIYYSHGFVRDRMQLFHDALEAEGEVSPYTEWLTNPAVGDTMARVTTQITCGDFFPQRDAALRAHATQIDPHGPFCGVPLSVQQSLWPTEEFELAKTRVKTQIPETDLFSGINFDEK